MFGWGAASGTSRCGRAIRAATKRSKRVLKNFAETVASVIPASARSKPIEVWFQDEARLWPSWPGLAPPGRDCSRRSLRSVDGGLDEVRDVFAGR